MWSLIFIQKIINTGDKQHDKQKNIYNNRCRNKKQAINDLKALVDRWEDDDEMYTTTMKIEIDQDFINAIELAIEALERENCNYRRR